ncbi:UNVERIFIED_CONTAM: hypothetical protein Sradi_1276900 [Sesamum radiatum]|uniref:Uncharacterized protein n=1 Tax=Sesamum radiatum TaxID=300843 RepID=A0AAW2UNN4_SESRA
MSYSEDEEAYEHTLLVVREVSVFKIPPRPPAAVTSAESGCSPIRSGPVGSVSYPAIPAARSDWRTRIPGSSSPPAS